MFADRAKFIIRSGRGGDGHVSFRREKFVPDGGPDGGDGGKGGDVIFQVDNSMDTLSFYRRRNKFAAGNGEAGGKKRCHGKNGEDVILKVPEGTVVSLAETGEVIADLSGENRRQVVLRGGRGGNGNMHYATSTMQAPTYAQPGQDARELTVVLELKLIADVGLVGYPNAGKSTLLRSISHAEPKVASYQFTTLTPNLGVVDLGDGEGFVAADIPGLIEGASKGAGLGHEFLRHIERCKVLVHLVDAAGTEGRDPVEAVRQINLEMSLYAESLARKKQVIAANKIDLLSGMEMEEGQEDPVRRLQEAFEKEGIRVFPISAATGDGIRELLYYVKSLLDQLPREVEVYQQEYFPEEHMQANTLPFSCRKDEKDPHTFLVEGPKVEKMLGYTNLESEKGFRFFQNFLKDSGILKELEKLGIEDGDTVRMYDLYFDYYAGPEKLGKEARES